MARRWPSSIKAAFLVSVCVICCLRLTASCCSPLSSASSIASSPSSSFICRLWDRRLPSRLSRLPPVTTPMESITSPSGVTNVQTKPLRFHRSRPDFRSRTITTSPRRYSAISLNPSFTETLSSRGAIISGSVRGRGRRSHLESWRGMKLPRPEDSCFKYSIASIPSSWLRTMTY